MSFIIRFIVGALLMCHVALANIMELKNENFVKSIDENDAVMVMFKSSSCGYCKKALPHYEEAASTLSNDSTYQKLRFATVECSTESDLCSSKGIQGYPTFKIYRGKLERDLKIGERTTAKFLEVIKLYKNKNIPKLSTQEVYEALTKGHNKQVALVIKTSDLSKFGEKLEHIYFNHCEDILLAHVDEDHEHLDKLLSMPSIKKIDAHAVIHRKSEDAKAMEKFSFESSKEDIEKFISEERIPLVAEVDVSNFQYYVESPKPLVYFFRNPDKDSEASQVAQIDSLRQSAAKFRSSLNFVLVDSKKYGQHAVMLGLTEEVPSIAVTNFTSLRNWLYEQPKDINSANLDDFFTNIVSGKLAYHTRSEKEPEKNDNDVLILTGNSAKSHLSTPNRDVVILFHAEHCGHCKSFMPTYESAAAKLKDLKDHILFTKLEATLNDVPADFGFDVKGYPTLYLVHGDSKTAVLYEGDRTIESVIDFVKTRAHNGSKVTVDTEKIAETSEEEEVPKDEL